MQRYLRGYQLKVNRVYTVVYSYLTRSISKVPYLPIAWINCADSISWGEGSTTRERRFIFLRKKKCVFYARDRRNKIPLPVFKSGWNNFEAGNASIFFRRRVRPGARNATYFLFLRNSNYAT